MAQGRWTRKCQDCDWVEPGASYPSKEFAEPNVDAGFGELEPRAPRCPECGSFNLEGVLVAETPEA